MSRQNERTLFLDGFWFPEQGDVVPFYAPGNGLYIGWALVFVLQMLTVAYSIVYALNLRVSIRLRDCPSIWLLILPVLTVVFGIYQLFVHCEIMYQDFGWATTLPDVGFWAAFLSMAILLVAWSGAPEGSHLRANSKALKRTIRKMLPVIALLFIFGLPLVAELEVQTGVSKEMLVGDREIYDNPALWEVHFHRISMLAGLFRARITGNSPNYAYCKLEVPVVSYGILAALLNELGYWAEEPTFGGLVTPV